MKRPGILTGIIPLAICIPCLVPVLLAAGVGAGTFSAFVAWFSNNGFVLVGAGVTAVAFSLLAWAVYARTRVDPACDVPAAAEVNLEQ